jgi:hypothetical protein
MIEIGRCGCHQMQALPARQLGTDSTTLAKVWSSDIQKCPHLQKRHAIKVCEAYVESALFLPTACESARSLSIWRLNAASCEITKTDPKLRKLG